MNSQATAAIPEQTRAGETERNDPAQEHGARIITVLEAAWAAIRERHPDVPRALIITGASKQSGGTRWGHYGAKFWATHDEHADRADELFVAGELFARGGRAVLETMLHEAAHGMASHRGIKDTDKSGRYHNKRYVRLAEELGLTGPQRPVKTHGWFDCLITDETRRTYADVIEAIDGARLPYLGAPLTASTAGEEPGTETEEQAQDDAQSSGTPGTQRAGRRFPVECRCANPRRIQITPKVWDEGELLCGNCKKPFQPVDQEDERTSTTAG